MGVVQLAKRAAGIAGADPKAEVKATEAELAALRRSLADRRAEAAELGARWLHAPTAEAAERIEADRRELLRTVERDALVEPTIEQRLAEARAEAQRADLERHYRATKAIYDRLRAAIEATAIIQAEAISAREAAIADLGEGLVARQLPIVAFRGLLLPDLVQIWSAELDRAFASPQPKLPTASPARPLHARQVHGTPGASATTPKREDTAAAPPARAGAAENRRSNSEAEPPLLPTTDTAHGAGYLGARPPAPARAAVRRQLRRDATAGERDRLVTIIRGGIDVDGFQTIAGDVLAVPIASAERLVLGGAADFAE